MPQEARCLGMYLGLVEVCQRRVLKSAGAELLGTAILVLIGCGSVATLAGPGATMAVAFSFGLGLAMAIWIFGQISGSHVNPAVSLGFFLTGHIGLLKLCVYCVAQVVGACLGSGLVWLTLPHGAVSHIGATSLAPGLMSWQGFLVEMSTSFLLALTVFSSCDRLRTDHSGSTALSIGFCVTANIAWSGNLTGGSMNPARSFGPSVWTGQWDDHWIYWTAPCVGGSVGALVYEYIFAVRTSMQSDDVTPREHRGDDVKRGRDYTVVVDSPVDKLASSPSPLSPVKTWLTRCKLARLDSAGSRRDSGLGFNDDVSEQGSVGGMTIYNTGMDWGGDNVSIITKL
ncbi:aquaporin AQPAn.G-like [Physella acuta]|uniref:aquaporin AQPAn.G-like n=1 Tax=Physella acuta TaxID=109671 RepID=UPI0027DD79D8|nr:aquaporin AQPAn.G-like [Physella acuta]